MSSFFCSNCKFELDSTDKVKEHYKSEFHRYNIKRQLVNLPPINEEQFQKKKAQLAEVAKQEEETLKCDACNKSFSSKPTFQQHLLSKKHKDAAKEFEENKKKSEADKQEAKKETVPRVTTAQDVSVCLFCNQKSLDLNENLEHMRVGHSFFISEREHVKNLEGLIKYLGEKVHKGCICIYCDNHHSHDFKSGEAVQRHMIDKGHCFMKTDDFDEYHKYYDFSDQLANMKKKLLIVEDDKPLKDGEAYLEMESGDDESEKNPWEDVDEDDEWEDEDGEEGEKGDENGEKEAPKDGEAAPEGEKIVKEKTEGAEGEEADKKPKKRVHRYKVRKAVVLPSGEIQLPNGTILGHRKYKELYTQYFRENARENFVKGNYLTYVGEKSLATLNQQSQIMLLNKALFKQQRVKEDIEIAHHVLREKKHYVKKGCRGHMLVHHFRHQNPK